MGVLREFRCLAHDLEFESVEERPRCPSGCSPKFVRQEFRSPPSIRSGGTHIQDQMTRQLAEDYRMTDMRNNDGESVMHSTRVESGGARQVGKPAGAYWNANLFSPTPGWAQRGEPAPAFNARAAGIKDGGVPIKAIQEGARNHMRKATVFANPEKQRK
jgi:hypothetical protein